ncbi:MAG: UDP-N-acetylmuramoyl-L-alanyl-D-glutamate--2,6-diaminopimelate ligase [Candidatus Kerfeldbacteria bacterium]
MRASFRRFIPKSLFGVYHGLLAGVATWRYRHPTREMTVIGITGTSGKTTVSLMLHAILELSGRPTAVATTALFAIRDKQWINDRKMTMLGRFALQEFLRRARRRGCTHAIIETTSEGLAQNRHRGLDYDVAVLTNLTPEHIESHGSFAKYRQAKERLFHVLTLTYRKPDVPKSIVVNADDPSAPAFLRHAADAYFTFSLERKSIQGSQSLFAVDIDCKPPGSSFELVHGSASAHVHLKLLGRMNVENGLAASAAALALGVPLETIADGLASISGIPGRLESIRAGGVTVIVDYAFHPVAMEQLYSVVDGLPHRRVVHVLGATGGGRDRSRRPILGRIASERAEVVIVTNEDPYDEDPRAIMEDVLVGVMEIGGRKLDNNVFRIFDRKSAIEKAISISGKGDIVLVTGKGSEQAIVVANGKRVPWDDREVVRSVLQERFGAVE